MFKKAILVILQTLLFFAAFGVGSFLPVFRVLPMWRVAVSATHYLVLDGLVVTLVVYLLVIALEAAMKRLRTAGGLTTLALVLALALGFAMKFGLMDRNGL